MPSSLTEGEHVLPPTPLNVPTPVRRIPAVALLLGVLAGIFLVLRCAYHISAASDASQKTKGRRISDDGFPNPCELPQEPKEQRQSHELQEAAGAASARREASASPSSGEGAASLGWPAAPSRVKYPSPLLDLIGLFDKTTSMQAWMLEVEAAQLEVGGFGLSGEAYMDALVRRGMEILQEVEGVGFSSEVRDEERQQFMHASGECSRLLKSLVEQGESHWVDACKAKIGILKSGVDTASSHMQRAPDQRRLGPDDPVLETMMGLRTAVGAAQEAHQRMHHILSTFPQLLALADAVGSLGAAIQGVEEALALAANACAEAWTKYLQDVRERWQAEGGEAGQQLLDDIAKAKEVQQKLRFISGGTLSK
ncbi:hypothetical protein EPH_0075850 [Eimeria praecox]|uniref:Uncharacterized protein n=1 Tax=Eimeria praecox TaxID=51316 RepID=U6H426_9EIME|nr:hypothetical protein EPH_0075850 [Eimeria praecox]